MNLVNFVSIKCLMVEFIVFKNLIICEVEGVFYVFEVLICSIVIGFVFIVWFVIYEMCYKWLLKRVFFVIMWVEFY